MCYATKHSTTLVPAANDQDNSFRSAFEQLWMMLRHIFMVAAARPWVKGHSYTHCSRSQPHQLVWSVGKRTGVSAVPPHAATTLRAALGMFHPPDEQQCGCCFPQASQEGAEADAVLLTVVQQPPLQSLCRCKACSQGGCGRCAPAMFKVSSCLTLAHAWLCICIGTVHHVLHAQGLTAVSKPAG